METFYREAGAEDAPVVLLPHGYPCSSYEFRNLMPRLADKWRLLAPDFPGAGYSGTPEDFDYSFDGYAAFLDAFVRKIGVKRFALWLHDFGSPIGARLAIKAPERIAAIILQNADIPYPDAVGPKYAELEAAWKLPADEMRAKLGEALSKETFKKEFLNDVRPELAERITPDLWKLHWSLVTPQRKRIASELLAKLKDNAEWLPQYRAYLRDHQPPALILWGPQDGYMPEKSGRAYLRDLPKAEFHALDAGHWLLEAQLDDAVRLTRGFLSAITI